jgi:small-conductance mechanosensitive channel
MLVLSNLDINISSLVASLGIGGIAVALALQNVLGDMFSSFSIYADKPFRVGDFIVIGKDQGTVEKIGMKTTRIRTLQGEELVVSNKELTSTRVQNFKKMKRRRVLFQLGVVYGTKPEQLESISKIIKEIVDKIDGVDYDRCHFSTYGDFSLNFEVVFYVNSSDYADYMNKKEKANLAIYKRFAEEKIEFAYPTQTIFVNKG